MNVFVSGDGGGGGGQHFMVTMVASNVYTNMGAADLEILNNTSRRALVDLSLNTEFRLICRLSTAGAAGADMRAQYSLDQSAWTNLDGGAGPELSLGAVGTVATPWTALHAAARADVFLRLMGKDGDGALDPNLQVYLEFR